MNAIPKQSVPNLTYSRLKHAQVSFSEKAVLASAQDKTLLILFRGFTAPTQSCLVQLASLLTNAQVVGVMHGCKLSIHDNQDRCVGLPRLDLVLAHGADIEL